jgi:hypothetical protein
MTKRSALHRALLFGAFLAVAPVLDVLIGGTAGLLHFIVTLSGIGVLAVSLSSGHPPIGYERYDPS